VGVGNRRRARSEGSEGEEKGKGGQPGRELGCFGGWLDKRCWASMKEEDLECESVARNRKESRNLTPPWTPLREGKPGRRRGLTLSSEKRGKKAWPAYIRQD